MKTIIFFALITFLNGCSNETDISVSNKTAENEQRQLKISYPETRKGEVVDSYFDIKIADPYRWLEDDMSDETESWVKAQNKTTFGYLQQIPYRKQLKDRLEQLWNYEKVTAPFKEGKYTYFKKNNGLQNQYVVYRQEENGKVEVFLDPNTFSEDGTTSLATLSFSKDGSLAAYSISEGGSDWRKIIIINAETKQSIGEPLTNIKFSGISWRGNEGFYYSSYDKPDGSELSAKTDQHKLYYHNVGETQAEDRVVFGDTEQQKRRYISGTVTEDDHYLLIQGAVSTSGNDLYLKDLTKDDSPLVTIQGNTDSDTYLIANVNSKLYLVTNQGAPNQKIVTVDAANPTSKNWVDFIPETDHVLIPSTGGGYFFTEYMVDATSQIFQYDYEGRLIKEIELAGKGSASSLSGKKQDKTLYYSFTNYKTPSTIYSYDVEKGQSTIFRKSGAKFDPDNYISKQVFYTSKDGTKIPMIITHQKDIVLNGTNPTILYGYGGFNVSLTPSFRISNAVWLEQGGIYAVPNLRGGGEYGKKWHKAGIKLLKQNVFDDFIAAAEYLIENKYTNSDHLAIRGGSNGGLLVGAVMTQRPDLMQVALPAVGVLDMLRYHTFTAGAGWAYDYGTAEESKEMFEYLLGYSPVQNVIKHTHYPATLITTGDHDDRVVPAHSFKFAAQLQAKQAGNDPTLIRIETNAGHGAGTPVSKTIEQYADIFGFTLFNMGYRHLPKKIISNSQKIYADYFEEYKALNPVWATFLGENQYNARFREPISSESLAKRLAFERKYLLKINTINPDSLSGQESLSYEVFINDRELAIIGSQFPSYLIPINQMMGIHNDYAQLGSGDSAQPFNTLEDYDNFIKRSDGFVLWMNSAITAMREGIKKGVVQPEVVMKKVIPQLAFHIVDNIKDSVFYKPLEQFPASINSHDKELLTQRYSTMIAEKLIPAYKRMHDFIVDEYLPKTRQTVGYSDLPDGKAWYDYQIKVNTTLNMTAEEIHQLGKQEVARILSEMRKVKESVGFEGSLSEFFTYLKTDDKFYFQSAEALIAGYQATREKINQLTPKLFSISPKADYEVRLTESYRAASSAGAEYQAPSPDGTRAGIFYINSYNLKAQPKFLMETLSMHEASPGHHFQITIQQEITDLPSFRRFGEYNVYSEGWALYAESLGKELGLFTDPMMWYGRLVDEQLRAMRLVVDTGLHALGWSREQAIQYMQDNSSMPESDIVAEVERYIAIPGQALGYKIGQFKIRELRDLSEKQLGENFDVKEFHRQILIDGALPMPILDAKIKRWIKAIKTSSMVKPTI